MRSMPIRSPTSKYQAKYRDYAATMGMTEEFRAAFSTRLKISIGKVWSTPTGG